jgi:hypothetical protein
MSSSPFLDKGSFIKTGRRSGQNFFPRPQRFQGSPWPSQQCVLLGAISIKGRVAFDALPHSSIYRRGRPRPVEGLQKIFKESLQSIEHLLGLSPAAASGPQCEPTGPSSAGSFLLSTQVVVRLAEQMIGRSAPREWPARLHQSGHFRRDSTASQAAAASFWTDASPSGKFPSSAAHRG